MSEISENLKAWMDRYGLTNKRVCELTGIPRRTLDDYKSGRRTPKGLARNALLEILTKPPPKAPKQ